MVRLDPSPNGTCWPKADMPVRDSDVRFRGVVSTGRRNTGANFAINDDTTCQNIRLIAFDDPSRNQLFHNTIFSAAPNHYDVTNLSSYTPYLFPLDRKS